MGYLGVFGWCSGPNKYFSPLLHVYNYIDICLNTNDTMFTQQLMRHFPLLLPAALVLLLTTCADKSAPVGVPNVMPGPYTPEKTPVTPSPAKTADRIDGSLHPMAYRSVIDGTVDYVSALRLDALLGSLPTGVDLGALTKAGQPVRMIALGGSLTAGVRNGGLYREGQLTAYPNLVARQMGIADFQTPAFGPTEANGTGFMVYSDPTAEYPRWKEVKNGLAPVQAGDPPRLSTYSGKVHNFAVPGGSSGLWTTWTPNADYDNGTGHKWLDWQLYLWRFLPSQENEKVTLFDHIKQKQPYEFFIYEDRTDGWLKTIRKNDNLNALSFISELNNTGSFYYREAAKQLAQGNKKGIVFTVPDFRDYAFMNWYPTDDLKRKASAITITYERNGYPEPIQLNTASPFLLLPTPAVAAIFSNLKQGTAVNAVLTDADVMDEVELRASGPDFYNEQVRRMAKDFDLALVDLNAIYKQIHQGTYSTDDGLKIDGSPKGNFFSSDGTYPTALGQAVIANEVIKAINNTYQARIPLINVSEFIQITGAR